MDVLTVDVAPSSTPGRLAARLASPARHDDELWFRVAPEHADRLAERADPFAVTATLYAMAEGCDLQVRGAGVSASLLRNLERFQEVWHAWYDLPVVDISADVVPDVDSAPSDPALAVYSGGVDSNFTVYQSATAPRPHDRPLAAALMIHGMDIPTSDGAGFDSAVARNRRMLDPLGVPLMTIATNAWELLPATVSNFAAVGLAASLHAVADGFSAGVISASDTYWNLTLPLASTPLSDPLLGRSGFEIVHEGSASNRLEKLRVLSTSEDITAHLRVCLEDPRHDRNCGRCRKCIITYISFQVLGVEARCFDTAPAPDEILRWVRHFSDHRVYINSMRSIVAEADRVGFRAPWVNVARRRVWLLTTRRAAHAVAPRVTAKGERLYAQLMTRAGRRSPPPTP